MTRRWMEPEDRLSALEHEYETGSGCSGETLRVPPVDSSRCLYQISWKTSEKKGVFWDSLLHFPPCRCMNHSFHYSMRSGTICFRIKSFFGAILPCTAGKKDHE